MSLLLNNKRRKSTGGGGSDPFWNNVVLFLKGDGTNGSTNIVDSSPKNKTISVFGTTQISTAQSKYGGSSIYFVRSLSNYLTVPASSDFEFTGDFTIELWIYWDGVETAGGSIFLATGGSGSTDQFGSFSNRIYAYGIYADNQLISPYINTWKHLAVSRTGNTIRLFEDGTLIQSITNSGILGRSNASLFIGRRPDNHPFGSYQDSIRITKGIGRYSANFNVETDTYLN